MKLVTCYVDYHDYSEHFLSYCVKDIVKIALSFILAEKRFLPILFFYIIIVNMFKLLRPRLHYDVILTSHEDGLYLLCINWKKKPIAILVHY